MREEYSSVIVYIFWRFHRAHVAPFDGYEYIEFDTKAYDIFPLSFLLLSLNLSYTLGGA